MVKWLKKFEEVNHYEAFRESDDYLLPNVSWITNSNEVKYNPIVKEITPKVTLRYMSTADNLLAFCNGGDNVKSLKIDGNNIEFEPLVNGLNEVEILNSEVKINNEEETFDFPDRYVITSIPSSIVVKPKDSNVKIGDIGNMMLFATMSGMKMCEPVPFNGLNGMFVIDEENNQLVCTEQFLASFEMIISYGYGYGFGFCTVNEETGEFTVVDSLMIYEGTSGGLKTPYYFDKEGVHIVEMELMSGDFGDTYMFYDVSATRISAPLISVVFNEKITSIGEYTFSTNTLLTEITCESIIAPTLNNSFDNIALYGTLIYPEGSDYSSWLSTEEGCLGYYGWNSEPTFMTGTISVTNVNNYYKLCGDYNAFIGVQINGEWVADNYHTFDSVGEYVVKYALRDKTTIGENAFSDCKGLTSVVIPDSVTSIGNEAFYGCSGLTSLVIGSGVTSISSYAFNGCSGLTEIVCHAPTAPTIQSYTFYNIKKGGTLIYPDGSDYSSWLSTSYYYLGYYKWNKVLSEITTVYNVTGTTSATKLLGTTTDIEEMVVDGVKLNRVVTGYTFNTTGEHTVVYKIYDIPNSVFSNCYNLTSVEIGSGVTTIGASAFTNCYGLTGELVIPDSVTSIGEQAFGLCTGLTGELVIPDSVTTIGSYAFSYCRSLTSVVIPNSVTSIGKNTFDGCYGLTSVVIPDSVTSIGTYAFYECKGLTSVVIPDSVTKISSNAFNGCSGLTEIVIPDSVTSIGYRVFSSCYGLESIVVEEGNPVYDSRENCNCIIETSTNILIKGCNNSFIPDSVTEIDDGAFSGCYGLTGELVIPNSVTIIDNHAFLNCSGLTSVVIPNSVTSIGYSAFYKCSGLISVVIPNSVTSIDDRAFESCYGLTGELVIPDSVTEIGSSAFWGCSGLTSVEISSGVTTIGGGAFQCCSGLETIVVKEGNPNYDSRENCNCLIETSTNTLIQGCKNSFIPDSVTSIDNRAFESCYGLTGELVIPDSVTSIGDSAFYGCSGLTSVEIGSEVTSIGSSAFGYCYGLTSVEIGSGVTTIGEYIFSSCSGLTEITSHAVIAPIIESTTFKYFKEGGVLKVPSGSDYSTWLSTSSYYLGYYNWTIEYI